MGTASLADDAGMFGGWTGSTVEGLVHTNASADLFTGASTGQGKSVTGAPTDGTIYTNQIRLFLKTAPNQVALGSSSSTLGAAGIAMNGANITSRLYTNPGIWTNTVDEFALMFNNTTASSGHGDAERRWSGEFADLGRQRRQSRYADGRFGQLVND